VFVGDLPAGNYRVRMQVKGRIEQQSFIKLSHADTRTTARGTSDNYRLGA
jgi:hypothetical protein